MKKIHINDLEIGMIVMKTDKTWLRLPFFNEPIKDEESITILKNFNVEHLFISNENEFNISKKSTEKELNTEDEIEFDLDQIDISNYTISLVELQEARNIYEKAKDITKNLYQDAKIGKTLDTEPVKNLVQNISTKFFKRPQVLTSMTRLKSYDEYTFVHSVNVSILCIALGKKMGYDGESMQQLGIGGLLHDIGKMKISDSIINKKGPLTEEEYEIAKKHPEYGYALIENDNSISQTVKDIVLQHHERFDGSGYPYGLKEYQISKDGQIAAIVDVYDAITSDRVYHSGRMPQEAIKIIHSLSGSHFSQAFVKFFIDVIGIYPVGTLVMLDTGELAIVFEKNTADPTTPKVIIVTNSNKGYIRPYLFDLSKYHLITKKYYKRIVAPLDSKEFDIDTNAIIDRFIKLHKKAN